MTNTTQITVVVTAPITITMSNVRISAIAGRGCFADREYAKDELIGEYEGEIITADEGDTRYEHADDDIIWLFDLGNGYCIDAMHTECPMKYVNHSCDPNCYAQVDGNKVFYYAAKLLKKGEELTVDYELIAEENEACQCSCNATNCRGTMKDKTAQEE